MHTKLFHREVFMPEKLRTLGKTRLELKPTGHAREAARTDRYGRIEIPREISFTGADVVEAEFAGGKLQKVVVRLKYDATRDAIFVCLVDGTLKTVWLNMANDTHKTLKKHLYSAA